MAGLTIAPATGNQGTTQNPQTAAPQTVGPSTSSGGVQPGTATALLTGEQGSTLHPSVLTTVSLTAGTQAKSQPETKPVQHHINPAVFGIPIALCLLAVGLFWFTARSAKSTTD